MHKKTNELAVAVSQSPIIFLQLPKSIVVGMKEVLPRRAPFLVAGMGLPTKLFCHYTESDKWNCDSGDAEDKQRHDVLLRCKICLSPPSTSLTFLYLSELLQQPGTSKTIFYIVVSKLLSPYIQKYHYNQQNIFYSYVKHKKGLLSCQCACVPKNSFHHRDRQTPLSLPPFLQLLFPGNLAGGEHQGGVP